MEEFRKHLLNYLDKDFVENLISSFEEPSKHAVLLNTNKLSEEKFLNLYPNVIKHPIVPHAFIYDKIFKYQKSGYDRSQGVLMINLVNHKN